MQALPFVAAGASLLGAASTVQQTRAVAAQSRQQEMVEMRNEQMALRDAETHRQDVSRQIMQYRAAMAAQMSTNTVKMAKANVDIGTGSALWLAIETANRADDQIAEIQLEGDRTGQAMQEEAVAAGQRASIAGMSGRAYGQAVLPQFGASLLTAGLQFGRTARTYGFYGV